MLVQSLIERKRDGEALPADSWRALVTAYVQDEIPDYQMSALLMAVVWRGLSAGELAALTTAMLESGSRLDFGAWDVPRVDKHSTGGIGDKVSLVLAPLVASCGVAVPMMSGRGLGHTGGTIDKLESIPGFRTDLGLAAVRAQVEQIGLAMFAQGDEIAPADRKLYALRDVTGTVPSVPLIAASIMSKKLAEGLDGLLLDVKAGSGAFLPAPAQALELARWSPSATRTAVAPRRSSRRWTGRSVGRSAMHSRSRRRCWHWKGRGPTTCSSWCAPSPSR